VCVCEHLLACSCARNIYGVSECVLLTAAVVIELKRCYHILFSNNNLRDSPKAVQSVQVGTHYAVYYIYKKTHSDPRPFVYRITRARLLRQSSLRATDLYSGPTDPPLPLPTIICAIHDFNRPPSTRADSLIAASHIMLRSGTKTVFGKSKRIFISRHRNVWEERKT